MPLLSLDEVRTRTDGQPRSLLLGNGFSIGGHHEFAYLRLLDRARFGAADQDARVRRTFAIAGLVDFESVIELVRQAARIAALHGVPPDILAAMQADIDSVRTGLAEAVAGVHPSRMTDMGDAALDSAARFLDGFDAIFSLSYDLLLYWAFLRADTGRLRDGFTRVDGRLVHADPPDQTVSYLHGALHLREEVDPATATTVTLKHHYGQVPLVEQIRTGLDAGHYPLVVMEGRWQAKLARIQGSPYLTSALRRLERTAGHLVTLGWALSESDQHLLQTIGRSAVTHLHVGIHGATAPDRARIEVRARELAREAGVEVAFWDSTTAAVWGP